MAKSKSRVVTSQQLKVQTLHPFESVNNEEPNVVQTRVSDPRLIVGKSIRSVICNTGKKRGSGPWIEIIFTDGASIVIQGTFVLPYLVPVHTILPTSGG